MMMMMMTRETGGRRLERDLTAATKQIAVPVLRRRRWSVAARWASTADRRRRQQVRVAGGSAASRTGSRCSVSPGAPSGSY